MRAFLYKDGGVINLGLPAGFEQVGVKGINASGLIVGQASRPGGITHPVYYDYSGDGVFVDMGSFRGSNGIAESVNDAGQIVGGANGTAFLWEDGAYSDLNDLIDSASGWQLQYAADINNVGQIVGQGLIGGVQHAFLLTPLSEAPEPATWAMMIVGFGMVGAVMRRQGKVRVAFG
jgi:probable HAF family extracellular repeat protein